METVIVEIPDGNTDFKKVEMMPTGVNQNDTFKPSCKTHGAMNKVSLFKNGGGYWRCLQQCCRAGCIENPEVKI